MRTTKTLLLGITALVATLSLAGCSETNNETLKGMLIKDIQIQGLALPDSDVNTILTAFTQVLNEHGAMVSKDLPTGITLNVKVSIESDSDGLPIKVTLDTRSKSGDLAALESYEYPAVFSNPSVQTVDFMSHQAAERTVQSFSRQYQPAKPRDDAKPKAGAATL